MDFVISASATEQDLSTAREFFVEQHNPSQPETRLDACLLVLVRRTPLRRRSRALLQPLRAGLPRNANKQ